jgi:hypothetical protein
MQWLPSDGFTNLARLASPLGRTGSPALSRTVTVIRKQWYDHIGRG